MTSLLNPNGSACFSRLLLLCLCIACFSFSAVSHPSNEHLDSSSTAPSGCPFSSSASASSNSSSSTSLLQSFLSRFPSFPDARKFEKGSKDYLALFTEETQLYNDIVLSFLPSKWRSHMHHNLQTWLRNYLAGCAVYLVGGALWCFYVYFLFGARFYPPGGIPSSEAIWKQIGVSMRAMPVYCALPTLSEWMIENGWTRCYSQVAEIGWAKYLLCLAFYLLLVEAGIYWAHRELHDVKPLYTWLHAIHHIYNKQNTLSPFAGLAFHPLDGIIQALPHVLALFIVPMHFLTHELLLFMEGVWTTNIHDNIHGNVFPIMGAGYHTIHHTTYRHNYGHYTILMDWMFGTLKTPKVEKPKAS